jgi:endonuclease/exonuclease/phosphatase family metal-dependent hydrolase
VRRLLVVLATGALAAVASPMAAGAGGTESSAHRPPATAAPKNDLRIVTMNILHGIVCPNAPDDCQGDDRMALLGQQLQAAKCPPVVALQEISERAYARVTAAPWLRTCKYRVVWHDMPSVDRELVLTTLPVRSQKLTVLAGNFRSAYRVELRSKLGPLVMVVTHQDGDSEPGADPRLCTPERCPPPCPQNVTEQACQTIQASALASEGGGKKAIRLLTGDFNVTATSDRYRSLVTDGWIDSHLAAGNAECDPATGTNCTSGRADMSTDDLKNPASKETERIDFLFVKPPRSCKLRVERGGDRDKDGLGTGLFADKPVANGPGGLAYLSDHTGVGADLSCG